VTRLRTITAGAALLAALVLGVLAYLLANSQSQDREDVRERFDDIATVSSSVTNGIFQAARQGAEQQSAARFGAEVTDADLAQSVAQGQLVYAAILDARGRRLAAAGNLPDKFGPATDTALETGKARLSDLMQLDDKGVIEWAIPYPAQAGQRVYVQGSPASAFEDFLKRSLGGLPTVGESETVMIDGNGVVLGGVNLSTDVGRQLPDDELLEAVEEGPHGTYGGDRYFASGVIDGSPFKIVLDTTEDDLYSELDTTLPWVIFAAFALTALAGLFLLRRMLSTAAEVERRELNERHAVEINDNIIQGLALAKYQLQRGEGEASATQLSDTLREAQRLVSGLLGDAEVQAGQLRRERAAETAGPEPPPDS
jgi:hypothetical protein